MSQRDVVHRSGDRSPTSGAQPYKRKNKQRLSTMFGPEHYKQHRDTEEPKMMSQKMINQMKSQGVVRTLYIYLSQNHPMLLNFILVLGFPLFIFGIFVMFLAALVCIFFTGIYIMIKEDYQEFRCFVATLLLPGVILIGGIGATFFPWIFKRYILQIHYDFWFEFAQEYFRLLFSVCC